MQCSTISKVFKKQRSSNDIVENKKFEFEGKMLRQKDRKSRVRVPNLIHEEVHSIERSEFSILSITDVDEIFRGGISRELPLSLRSIFDNVKQTAVCFNKEVTRGSIEVKKKDFNLSIVYILLVAFSLGGRRLVNARPICTIGVELTFKRPRC